MERQKSSYSEMNLVFSAEEKIIIDVKLKESKQINLIRCEMTNRWVKELVAFINVFHIARVAYKAPMTP
jgi:hypothetical protein